jgi:HSP20 family protein
MELKDYDPWLVVGQDAAGRLPRRTRTEEEPAWTPVMDAFHTDDEMVLRYETPGVEPEDLELRVDGRVLYVRGIRQPTDGASPELTMRAERVFGEFDRSIVLPDGTDPTGVRASYRHGVLEIRVAHVHRRRPRDVPVEVLEEEVRPIEVRQDVKGG